jgi:N-carbamoylputrescine amidase
MDSQQHDQRRALRVAVVQMPSRLGEIEINLERATTHAEHAAAEGAQLILFHELMPGGYAWNDAAWRGAEPTDGLTTRWLRREASRLGAYIGTSYLEASGGDFWNTFVLAGPEGRECGRVRKEFPAMFEARTFRGAPGSHVIETPIGRIGVAICFDAHTASVARLLAAADVDLVLAPHCYCVPSAPRPGTSQADIDRLTRNLAEIAPLYARTLGVATASTNRVGEWDAAKGDPFLFVGQATIADSDGVVLSRLGAEEDVALADVVLDPARRTRAAPVAHSRWIYPGPPGRELLRLIEWWEGRRYARSGERRSRALAVELAGAGR